MDKPPPSRDEIDLNTPLRLSVAAALAFPDGSLTASGLRREHARGRLVVERIAGKDYEYRTDEGAMPRRSKSARLWLRKRRGRAAQWVILDHGRELRTGAGENDLRAAENALAEHLANKRRPQFGDGHPSNVLIADILADYGENHGPTTDRPDLIGGAINKFIEFFGDQTASAITSATCKKYVQWRVRQFDARAKVRTRSIRPSTAGRELVVLGAALRWCWREGKLDRLVPVSLPAKPSPRQRHLSRGEVAALLAGALGWDRQGNRHPAKVSRHLARFILIALYT